MRLVVLLVACSAPPAPVAPKRDVCVLDTRRAITDGFCVCDIERAGDEQDDTHAAIWKCGKTRHRSDGCPDDLALGMPCTGSIERCNAFEGPCFEPLVCLAGRWSNPAYDLCKVK